jgi:hypothetical protein
MNWTEILKFFLSVSCITAIIIYVGKKLVDKTLDAGIEKYKNNLNKELESFKSDLNRFNIEHQIKYNKLYEQRGEKIKELYQLIYELEKKLKFFTSVFQGPEWSAETERGEAVRIHVLNLEDVLELNRIYFSDDLCIKVELIIKESRDIMSKIHKAKYIRKHHNDLIASNKGHLIENPLEPLESWNEAESYVLNEMNTARLELVKEFHKIIGVR